jgi:hypothetical protein
MTGMAVFLSARPIVRCRGRIAQSDRPDPDDEHLEEDADHGVNAESTPMAVSEHLADPARLCFITRGGLVGNCLLAGCIRQGFT